MRQKAKTYVVAPLARLLAPLVARLPISPVAAVYTEPAKVVTTPAPLVASVMASPPAEVMIVASEPPIAIETKGVDVSVVD